MIAKTNVYPVITAPCVFFLGPLYLHFAADPGEYEYDTGHPETQGVVFFELHSQDFCFPR
jgi:hypothetical protein